jgi:hypothetical protein
VLAEARALGLPEEMAAGLAASAQPAAAEAVEVMPENWGAMRVFLGMETQWRRAGMAGVAVGLDYGALPVVAGALGVTADADLFGRLRILEGAALAVMAERA